MHAKLLIDAIMRQTTVLIAQLSTAARIRAPVAHVSAVANAIAAKVRRGPRSAAADYVGGTTISFQLSASHPDLAEVYDLLSRVRTEVNELWGRVGRHNEAHPVPEEDEIRVTFYFGQNVETPDDDARPLHAAERT